jgi:hypothetical protein
VLAVPGAPTNVQATARTSSNGGKAQRKDGDKSPIKVGGLTAGKSYTCTVAAHNKVGFGPAATSNSFTPTK